MPGLERRYADCSCDTPCSDFDYIYAGECCGVKIELDPYHGEIAVYGPVPRERLAELAEYLGRVSAELGFGRREGRVDAVAEALAETASAPAWVAEWRLRVEHPDGRVEEQLVRALVDSPRVRLPSLIRGYRRCEEKPVGAHRREECSTVYEPVEWTVVEARPATPEELEELRGTWSGASVTPRPSPLPPTVPVPYEKLVDVEKQAREAREQAARLLSRG